MNEPFANAFADVQNLETLANISAQAASLPNDEVQDVFWEAPKSSMSIKQFCTSSLHLIVFAQKIRKT